MSEGYRELKWTCPLCSCIGNLKKFGISVDKEIVRCYLKYIEISTLNK